MGAARLVKVLRAWHRAAHTEHGHREPGTGAMSLARVL